MTAMRAAARRPLPLPAMGATAFDFAVPVVKVPPVVEAAVVAMVLVEDCAGAPAVVAIVLASLFGINTLGSRCNGWKYAMDVLRSGIAPRDLRALSSADLGIVGAEVVATVDGSIEADYAHPRTL
jgi:hypothetical protein